MIPVFVWGFTSRCAIALVFNTLIGGPERVGTELGDFLTAVSSRPRSKRSQRLAS